MTYHLIEEFKLDQETKQQIADLVQICFPDTKYQGRTYFKQLPHYRFLAKENEKIIAQLGLDYRMMALDGQPLRIMGIIDLVVSPQHQGKGLGTKLLKELDNFLKPYAENIDFLFLVADKHKFYENCGYKLVKQKVQWLAMSEHKNYGLQIGEFNDCLMIKQIGQISWTERTALDMLGYWY